MYFLSGEETKWLLKHLIQEYVKQGLLRNSGVELASTSLDPPYAVKAGGIRGSWKVLFFGEDLFLRQVAGLPTSGQLGRISISLGGRSGHSRSEKTHLCAWATGDSVDRE